MEKTCLRRHRVRPTCLAYRDKVRRAKVKQEKLTQKEKAQPQGFRCPHCGYDYGPFARPFFEGAKSWHLRRMRCMLRGGSS